MTSRNKGEGGMFMFEGACKSDREKGVNFGSKLRDVINECSYV